MDEQPNIDLQKEVQDLREQVLLLPICAKAFPHHESTAFSVRIFKN